MWVALSPELAVGVGPFKTEEAARRYAAAQPDGKDWRVVYISWPGRWSN